MAQPPSTADGNLPLPSSRQTNIDQPLNTSRIAKQPSLPLGGQLTHPGQQFGAQFQHQLHDPRSNFRYFPSALTMQPASFPVPSIAPLTPSSALQLQSMIPGVTPTPAVPQPGFLTLQALQSRNAALVQMYTQQRAGFPHSGLHQVQLQALRWGQPAFAMPPIAPLPSTLDPRTAALARLPAESGLPCPGITLSPGQRTTSPVVPPFPTSAFGDSRPHDDRDGDEMNDVNAAAESEARQLSAFDMFRNLHPLSDRLTFELSENAKLKGHEGLIQELQKVMTDADTVKHEFRLTNHDMARLVGKCKGEHYANMRLSAKRGTFNGGDVALRFFSRVRAATDQSTPTKRALLVKACNALLEDKRNNCEQRRVKPKRHSRPDSGNDLTSPKIGTRPEDPSTRNRLTKLVRDQLCEHFDRNPQPDNEERERLASALDLTPKQVLTWFQNRRRRYGGPRFTARRTGEFAAWARTEGVEYEGKDERHREHESGSDIDNVDGTPQPKRTHHDNTHSDDSEEQQPRTIADTVSTSRADLGQSRQSIGSRQPDNTSSKERSASADVHNADGMLTRRSPTQDILQNVVPAQQEHIPGAESSGKTPALDLRVQISTSVAPASHSAITDSTADPD